MPMSIFTFWEKLFCLMAGNMTTCDAPHQLWQWLLWLHFIYIYIYNIFSRVYIVLSELAKDSGEERVKK